MSLQVDPNALIMNPDRCYFTNQDDDTDVLKHKLLSFSEYVVVDLQSTGLQKQLLRSFL